MYCASTPYVPTKQLGTQDSWRESFVSIEYEDPPTFSLGNLFDETFCTTWDDTKTFRSISLIFVNGPGSGAEGLMRLGAP